MAPTMARAPAILPMTVPAITPGLVPRLPPSLACGLLSIDILGSNELVVLLKMLIDAASVLVAVKEYDGDDIPSDGDMLLHHAPRYIAYKSLYLSVSRAITKEQKESKICDNQKKRSTM
jgi:hypothetical protein